VVVLAATAGHLRRLARQDDIVIGFPIRARVTRTALTTPAMMSNELPLRLHVTTRTIVDELVAQVAERIGELLAYQRHRGEELHRALCASSGDTELPGVTANVISFDGVLIFAGSTGTVRQ
jgi:non-ribosomal peptide synthetase component F